jgi:hypothetical protein
MANGARLCGSGMAATWFTIVPAENTWTVGLADSNWTEK